ncbi:MAG: hypothetical protein ACRC0V_12800, partial [Fusobacteriaceae bacterium]
MLELLKKYCEDLKGGDFRLSTPESIYECLYLKYYEYCDYVDVSIKIVYELDTDIQPIFKITS